MFALYLTLSGGDIVVAATIVVVSFVVYKFFEKADF